MVKASFLVLLLCTLFISGCTSDTVPDGPLPITYSKFIPLEVGNFWIYRVQAFKVDGTLTVDVPDTLSAVSKQGRYGFDAYQLVENSNPTNSHFYYFDGDTTFAFEAYPPGSITDTIRSIIGVNSMNSGEELILTDQVGANNAILRDVLRLEATDASVNLGFEQFKCQKMIETIIQGTLTEPDTTQKQIFYYAIGKGMILQENYFKDKASNKLYLGSSLTLTSYFVQ